MHFHAQNLNETKRGAIKGSMLRQGRCWLYFGDRNTLRAEWSFFSNSGSHLKIGLADYEEEIDIRMAFGVFSLSLGFENHKLGMWIKRMTKRADQAYGNGRTIGITFHGGYIWIDLWYDPMESRSTDPWWWHISINPMDKLFGRYHHKSVVLEIRDIEVPMPEKAYPATATLSQYTWKRPRLPLVKSRTNCNIDIPGGIPHEGKGENSWDCGIDATFGMSMSADSIYEGVGKLVTSVLKTRVKYGGWDDWNFKKPWPEVATQ